MIFINQILINSYYLNNKILTLNILIIIIGFALKIIQIKLIKKH